MYGIGVIPMPTDFKYLDVFLQGRPKHDRFDPFTIRHPPMDCGKRAKLFSPFDALRGFNFAIMAKEIHYEEKPEFSLEDLRELNRRLEILRNLTYTSRMARQNQVYVKVTYYLPCSDPNNESFGKRGQLCSIEGICRGVDPDVTMSIRIDNQQIQLSDLIRIESIGDTFERQYEEWNYDEYDAV